VHPASMIMRARVLLALDTSVGVVDPKEAIAARPGVSGETLGLVAKRFAETGGDAHKSADDAATSFDVTRMARRFGKTGRPTSPRRWSSTTSDEDEVPFQDPTDGGVVQVRDVLGERDVFLQQS